LARKRAARVKDKWTLKKWYTLIAPEYFGMAEVGMTPADDESKLINRVNRVAGENAYTKFHQFELTRDYMNSLVRRRTSKIEDVVDVTTSDGYVLRVKPVTFTIKRCRTSQKKAIRSIMRKIVLEYGTKENFIQFLQECVLGKIPSEIYKNAKRIYPLRRVEIRKIELLKEPAKVEEIAA
jgi:small subunit ribosomal protein S3Ae